jgi:hypothetical protein
MVVNIKDERDTYAVRLHISNIPPRAEQQICLDVCIHVCHMICPDKVSIVLSPSMD